MYLVWFVVFFFRQKTAYEMRISDWSSDVCSSDLALNLRRAALAQIQGGHRSAQRGRGLEVEEVRPYAVGDDARSIDWRVTARRGRLHTKQIGRASRRERVCQYV